MKNNDQHQTTALRCLWRRLKRRVHGIACGYSGHRWEYDEHNNGKRTCAWCGRHEWLFSRPFPMVGEPAMTWEHMPSGDRM